MENRYNPEKDKFGNTVELETNNAQYRIIYGIHAVEQAPEVVDDSEGLIIEGIGDFSTIEKIKSFLKEIKKIPQHKKLIDYCQEKNKSLYLVDLNSAIMAYSSQATVSAFLEMVVGSGVGCWAVKDQADAFLQRKIHELKNPSGKDVMSRRSFLKKTATAAKALSSAYLLSPFLGEKFGQSLSQPEEGTLGRTIDRDVISFNENLHPEVFGEVITFRNHLIAQKAEYIAKKLTNGKNDKPKLSILIGATHSGLESALQKSPEERMAVLNDTIVDNPKLKQSQIVRIDFSGNDFVPTFMTEDSIEDM